MTKKKEPKAAAPAPAPMQQPGLPGLTVAEIKSLLGDKEILILQMTTLVNTTREQAAALAKALVAANEEIARLKGKKPAKTEE